MEWEYSMFSEEFRRLGLKRGIGTVRSRSRDWIVSILEVQVPTADTVAPLKLTHVNLGKMLCSPSSNSFAGCGVGSCGVPALTGIVAAVFEVLTRIGPVRQKSTVSRRRISREYPMLLLSKWLVRRALLWTHTQNGLLQHTSRSAEPQRKPLSRDYYLMYLRIAPEDECIDVI